MTTHLTAQVHDGYRVVIPTGAIMSSRLTSPPHAALIISLCKFQKKKIKTFSLFHSAALKDQTIVQLLFFFFACFSPFIKAMFISFHAACRQQNM